MAKTCDVALLLVDSAYGFVVEMFEFLNSVQMHDFPRAMGVLTHLGKYVRLKKKQSIVYRAKHRFWKVMHAGAKLFVLKGVDARTGLCHHLVRFVSVLEFRPLRWCSAQSYLLADRFEDLTEPARLRENADKADRIVAFGYASDCHLRARHAVHLMGVDDVFDKHAAYIMVRAQTRRWRARRTARSTCRRREMDRKEDVKRLKRETLDHNESR